MIAKLERVQGSAQLNKDTTQPSLPTNLQTMEAAIND